MIRFLDEQTDIDQTTGQRTPKANQDIKSGSIQSAYDQDATDRKKGHVQQSGYVLQISETCADDNPFQLLTDYAVAPNQVSDPAIKETGWEDLYVDGGFHSETVHQAAEEHHIHIHLTNMSGTKPREKMEPTAFEIDEQTHEIRTRPVGQVPSRVKPGISERCPLHAYATARFRRKTVWTGSA